MQSASPSRGAQDVNLAFAEYQHHGRGEILQLDPQYLAQQALASGFKRFVAPEESIQRRFNASGNQGVKGIASLLSELVTAMQSNDTRRQVVVIHVFEARILHHPFQGFWSDAYE